MMHSIKYAKSSRFVPSLHQSWTVPKTIHVSGPHEHCKFIKNRPRKSGRESRRVERGGFSLRPPRVSTMKSAEKISNWVLPNRPGSHKSIWIRNDALKEISDSKRLVQAMTLQRLCNTEQAVMAMLKVTKISNRIRIQLIHWYIDNDTDTVHDLWYVMTLDDVKIKMRELACSRLQASLEKQRARWPGVKCAV